MADIAKTRIKIRNSRRVRIRRQIQGTAERPRLAVKRSLAHMYAQVIDDVSGTSIAQISSLNKDILAASKDKTKTEVSQLVGKKISELALEKGVKTVIFDRGGFLYHGRVKALADSARESGLQF